MATVEINYAPPFRPRRYSWRSIVTLTAGSMTGPLLAGPVILTFWLTAHSSEPLRDLFVAISLTLAMFIAVTIPTIGFYEKHRLRNTSGVRGKRFVRNGLIMYGLWIGVPTVAALLVLLTAILYAVFTHTSHPPQYF